MAWRKASRSFARRQWGSSRNGHWKLPALRHQRGTGFYAGMGLRAGSRNLGEGMGSALAGVLGKEGNAYLETGATNSNSAPEKASDDHRQQRRPCNLTGTRRWPPHHGVLSVSKAVGSCEGDDAGGQRRQRADSDGHINGQRLYASRQLLRDTVPNATVRGTRYGQRHGRVHCEVGRRGGQWVARHQWGSSRNGHWKLRRWPHERGDRRAFDMGFWWHHLPSGTGTSAGFVMGKQVGHLTWKWAPPTATARGRGWPPSRATENCYQAAGRVNDHHGSVGLPAAGMLRAGCTAVRV